jgi:hypothetical protein
MIIDYVVPVTWLNANAMPHYCTIHGTTNNSSKGGSARADRWSTGRPRIGPFAAHREKRANHRGRVVVLDRPPVSVLPFISSKPYLVCPGAAARRCVPPPPNISPRRPWIPRIRLLTAYCRRLGAFPPPGHPTIGRPEPAVRPAVAALSRSSRRDRDVPSVAVPSVAERSASSSAADLPVCSFLGLTPKLRAVNNWNDDEINPQVIVLIPYFTSTSTRI